MNLKTIVTLLIILILLSIAAGYVAGFYVYREYREKTEYLERRSQDKFKELDDNLKELYVDFENRMDENKVEIKDVLSRMGSVKEAIQEWKRGYKVTLSELRGEIEDLKVDRLTRMVENLQEELEGFKMTVQDLDLKIDAVSGTDAINVDLGTISVQKPQRRDKGR